MPRRIMRAIFEALSWGDWVDEGDSMPRYCTLQGVAKTPDAGQEFLVVNEYVAAELARVIGLPAVPGLVVKNDRWHGFVSLRFGPKGERPPPGIPSVFAEQAPALAAGVVVFDCWIGNHDRHADNFAYSTTTTRTHLFDHDRALLSTEGVARLDRTRDQHGLKHHPIGLQLKNGAYLLDWATQIQKVSDRSLSVAVDELRGDGLVSPDVAFRLVDFLQHRRDRIIVMIREARDAGCFPAIMQSFIL